MIDKITFDDFLEEIYKDQLELLKDSDLSAKERNEQKEQLKENILESEYFEDLKDYLVTLGYKDYELLNYFISFFVEDID